MAQIHQAYELGHSLAGAVTKARARYPGVSLGRISELVDKIYSSRNVLDDYIGGNMGEFINPLKHFGCTGNSIRFTTYTTFIDADTGLAKEFWIDTVVSFTTSVIHRGDLIWMLYNEGVLAAKNQGYNPKPLLPGATATEIAASGTLKLTGFQCV